MSIVLRYFIRNIREKKGRTILVIFSIAVSAALIFSNSAFSSTTKKMIMDASLSFTGNADLVIKAQKLHATETWFSVNQLPELTEDVEYILPLIIEKGLYQSDLEATQYLTIIGTYLEQYDIHNPLTLIEGDKDDFIGYKVIVSKAFTAKNNLKIYDSIIMDINGIPYTFIISGIGDSKGLFRRDNADGGFALIPKDTLEEIYGANTNEIFISLKDKKMVKSKLEEYKLKFPDFKVNYANDKEIQQGEVDSYTLPFKMSSISVIIMSFFIIFTAFGVISVQRMPTIGTFRSIGCTKKRLNFYLIIENLIYGFFGGIFGCVLGLGILEYILRLYFSGELNFAIPEISFGFNESCTTVLFAIGLSLVSGIIPILKTTKIPIKKIFLNDFDSKQDSKKLWFFIGTGIFLVSLIIPFVTVGNLSGMIITSITISCILFSLVLITPMFAKYISKVVSKMTLFKHEVVLGVKNVSDDKNLLNNIRLFAITIAIIGFMNTIFYTLSSDLTRYYTENTYDVHMSLFDDDSSIQSRVESIEGIDKIGVRRSVYGLIIPKYESFINVLYGIEDESILNFMSADIQEAGDAFKNINTGNSIILTEVLRLKFNLKIGDMVTIPFEDSNKTFKVTGFIQSTEAIGHLAFISLNNFKQLCPTYYTDIYIKGNIDPNELKLNLKREFFRDANRIETKLEMQKNNSDKTNGIFNSINSYANIALIIGIIGIINNIIISFIKRKKTIAMYRCIGMSKKGVMRVLVAESITIGVLGVVLGLTAVLIMAPIIPNMVTLVWGNVAIKYAVSNYLTLAGFGIVSMILVSFIPAINYKKLSIIQSIKYE